MHRLSSLVLLMAACGSSLPANPCGELIRVGGTCVCPDGSTPIDAWRCALPDGGVITAPNAPDGSVADAEPSSDAGLGGDASCVPTPEVCNGRDDDCNGSADDAPEFECVSNSRGECTTECGSTGTRDCSPSSCTWTFCTPPTEQCNYRDDDCDGRIDPEMQTLVFATEFGVRNQAMRSWAIGTSPVIILTLFDDGTLIGQRFDSETRAETGSSQVVMTGLEPWGLTTEIVPSLAGGFVIFYSRESVGVREIVAHEYGATFESVRSSMIASGANAGSVAAARGTDGYLVVFENGGPLQIVRVAPSLVAGTPWQVEQAAPGMYSVAADTVGGYWLTYSRWPGGLFVQRVRPEGIGTRSPHRGS